MCDPVGMIGLAFSIGSQVMQMQAQQDLYNKQQSANEQWLSYQRMKAREENVRQESMRQRAEAARKGALEQLTPEEQMKAREEEEQRLGENYLPEQPAPAGGEQLIGDQLIQQSTQGGAGKTMLQNDLAAKLAQASKQARQRIQALAAVDSYGGQTQFGMQNRANDIFGEAQGDIRMMGNQRRGSLVAYGAEKQVEPLQYRLGAGSQSFSGVGSALAGVAGKSIGAAMGGGSSV